MFYLIVYSSPGGGVIVFTHVNIEVGKQLRTNAQGTLGVLPPCSSAPWQWLKKLPGTSQQVFPAHYHTDRATAAPRWARMGFVCDLGTID